MEPLGTFALLCFTSLLAILNPLSAVPLYLALTEGHTPAARRHTVHQAIPSAFVVLLVFAFVGGTIFQLFGITIDAFRIAGGILFFGIGLDMLQAKRSRVKTTEEEEREASTRPVVGVTPLGIPMLSGPGAITTVMVLMTQATTFSRVIVVFGAIVAVLLVAWIVLASAPTLIGHFGQTGLNVMTRIMGLLVTVIGVQFIIDGARPILIDVIRRAGGI